jgi:hypothetical protein
MIQQTAHSLNYRLTITKPGHYLFTARAGNIVLSDVPSNEEKAPEATSNSIKIDVVRDEGWSAEQLRLAVAKFNGNQDLEHYAGQSYCTGEPLLEENLAQGILNHAQGADP